MRRKWLAGILAAAMALSLGTVNAQAADGYEILFGAENPQIAKVMGTSELDYDDFTPLNLYSTTYGAVCVAKDSPYETVEQLVDDVLANPGKVVMATTGAGGLPETVAAMMADGVAEIWLGDGERFGSPGEILFPGNGLKVNQLM